MALSLPRRPLFRSGLYNHSHTLALTSATTATCFARHHSLPITFYHLHSQHRTISLRTLNPFKPKTEPILDPAALSTLRKETESKTPTSPELPKTGDLAPGSVFEDPNASSSPTSETPERDPHAMAAALDPTPIVRKRWQRKMVIRDIRGRGRLSKTEKIVRTERQHLVKSPWIKTSIKKLYPLARQIAGKPLHEAMVQMRFSKKKAAQDVLRHLEYARDQAVVVRGMGLGRARAAEEAGEKGGPMKGEEESVVVEDKKGKKRVVGDRSAMYVDEAWVGRGKYESGSDHRARGQIHRLRLPYTSESFVLLLLLS